MSNVSLYVPLIDVVESYRLSKGLNLWSDMLYLDILWIWLEWD